MKNVMEYWIALRFIVCTDNKILNGPVGLWTDWLMSVFSLNRKMITDTWTSLWPTKPWTLWMSRSGPPTTCTWRLWTNSMSGLCRPLSQQAVSFNTLLPSVAVLFFIWNDRKRLIILLFFCMLLTLTQTERERERERERRERRERERRERERGILFLVKLIKQ